METTMPKFIVVTDANDATLVIKVDRIALIVPDSLIGRSQIVVEGVGQIPVKHSVKELTNMLDPSLCSLHDATPSKIELCS